MVVHNSYLVSVTCNTYNHHAYISDAMNGFVMQQTNFPYVCIIVDDASIDGEQEVIRKFVAVNFDLQDVSVAYEKDTDYGHIIFAQHKTNKNCYFAVVLLKENHYSQGKSRRLYYKEWLDAKYIALCEGDDYWIDSLKLQKQVDYLESHSNCCMSAHASYTDFKGEWLEWGCQHKIECDLTTDEVIRNGGLYLATASLFFRSELLFDRPEWMKMADVLDYPLQVLGTLRGSLHFLPEKMCVYRYQYPGSWTYNTLQEGHDVDHFMNEIRWLTKLDDETGHQYSNSVYFHLIKFYSVLYRHKLVHFNDYFRVFKNVPEHSYKRLLKDILIRLFPGLYDLYKKVTSVQ